MFSSPQPIHPVEADSGPKKKSFNRSTLTVAESRIPTAAPWRRWASQHRVASATLAGLIAVHMSSVLGFWFGGFGLTRLDWNTANGLVYWPKGSPFEIFMVGWTSHYLDGVVFSVLFAVALHPRMPWRNTELGNAAKGLVFGTVLAVVALAVLTPLVYAPARGADAGFFSSNFGWKYMVAVFLFHWIYGLHLGLIYNPLPDEDVPARPQHISDAGVIGSDFAMVEHFPASGEALDATPLKVGAPD